MGIGGKYPQTQGAVGAELVMAYTGHTHFSRTEWNQCQPTEWVLDYINRGTQRQAVGSSAEFDRPSGVAALYEPGTPYREYRPEGQSVDESYITFRLSNNTEETFHRLTQSSGWIHVRDPDATLEERLRRVGEVLFYRGPGYQLEARGLFLELLGILEASVRIGPRLRQVRRRRTVSDEEDMAAVVERYIREHINETVEVEDLAREVGMSLSSFAHAYPASCGETPYQTVLRLKVETAKRLLLWEEASVKEAANRTGFSSQFHLSRVFKRLEGLPPTDWMRVLREKGELPAPKH